MDCAKLLIVSSTDVNDADFNTNTTPLHLAAEAGSPDCVKMLLDRKANVNAKDSNSCMPLHKTRNFECAKLLVAGGASELFNFCTFAWSRWYKQKLIYPTLN